MYVCFSCPGSSDVVVLSAEDALRITVPAAHQLGGPRQDPLEADRADLTPLLLLNGRAVLFHGRPTSWYARPVTEEKRRQDS